MEKQRVLDKWIKTFQKLRRIKITLLAVSTVFLFLLSSCGGGTAPPTPPAPGGKTPGAETKKAGPVQVAAKVEKKKAAEKEEPAFTYNPVGKPDPFKPFIQPEQLRKSALLTPLQKYDISQLKLVAIITLPEGSVALVEDQQGRGYFLKRGTLIGRHDGKVKAIHKDRVIIEEALSDVLGQGKVNEIPLFLHRPPEEGGES